MKQRSRSRRRSLVKRAAVSRPSGPTVLLRSSMQPRVARTVALALSAYPADVLGDLLILDALEFGDAEVF